MKIRTTIDNELEKLDLKWRNLPVRKQIRYVLYLFAFYMLLGVGVMIKVFYDLGKDDGMEIRHIEAPAVIKGDPISNKVKSNKNGRERE
ncbi:nitrogen regulatory IIA protein [Chryseobacterium gallinarum]|uniref:Nitrogen regulatory IIA protein n=1 Tax=Chryseobacterium gallinarum TaxID=1324352 RepID=A0A0G3LWI8_CHRGL|nr:nitrogen regulatory IIA protein [Chryseobacterium gallinarum]AKK71326.1 nitrogen regulatory IIA protein [Chryseobacterium gallinarum]